MGGLDRREFLRRAGVAAAIAGVGPAGLELLRPAAAGGSDPRLSELARAMAGPVYARGSHGYDRTHAVYNRRYDHVEPLAVAQPETPADVQACVEWARRHDIRLIPRAG